MTIDTFKALVVDDDVIARRAVGFALAQEDFNCAFAIDGDDARNRLATDQYDLVVTDLRMPNTHGHSLAIELLSIEQPPVIVVHSSIDDPRLTKDLLLRGVDDIVYKPTNYAALAAKVRALVTRRKQTTARTNTPLDVSTSDFPENASSSNDVTRCPIAPIGREEYESRLGQVQHLFPLSTTAYEVYQLSNCGGTSCQEIAATILNDAALTAEVLRLAHSVYYSRNRPATILIEEAVARVGFKKVGEIALSLNAMCVLRSCMVPWIDANVDQARSLAARIALEILLETSDFGASSDGLTLCAFLHPLGRVVLGSVFQDEYKALVRYSRDRTVPLSELEALVFPESHYAALGRVLTEWKIPMQICTPMAHLGETYETISKLDRPLRCRVELTKLAVAIGEMAVGVRLHLDQQETPPKTLFERHKVQRVEDMVEKVKMKL